jgi:hypothetical protein
VVLWIRGFVRREHGEEGWGMEFVEACREDFSVKRGECAERELEWSLDGDDEEFLNAVLSGEYREVSLRSVVNNRSPGVV